MLIKKGKHKSHTLTNQIFTHYAFWTNQNRACVWIFKRFRKKPLGAVYSPMIYLFKIISFWSNDHAKKINSKKTWQSGNTVLFKCFDFEISTFHSQNQKEEFHFMNLRLFGRSWCAITDKIRVIPVHKSVPYSRVGSLDEWGWCPLSLFCKTFHYNLCLNTWTSP